METAVNDLKWSILDLSSTIPGFLRRTFAHQPDANSAPVLPTTLIYRAIESPPATPTPSEALPPITVAAGQPLTIPSATGAETSAGLGKAPTVGVRERADAGDLGKFDVLADSQHIALSPRPREPALSLAQWRQFLPEPGALAQNEAQLREAIFRSSLAPEARPEAWRYLLNHWPPADQTPEEFRAEKFVSSLLPTIMSPNKLM